VRRKQIFYAGRTTLVKSAEKCALETWTRAPACENFTQRESDPEGETQRAEKELESIQIYVM